MRLTCLNILLFVLTCASAQSYYVNGNARALGGDCYELTSNNVWQSGTVWYTDQLDLSKSFELEFSLNFGSNDGNGADGLVFVLQTAGTSAQGTQGGGMGYEGFSPSFGIEFDDYQNTSSNDPSYDHISYQTNGGVSHATGSGFTQAVRASHTKDNIEDGKDHLVKVVWDSETSTMRTYFDCYLRVNKQVDMTSIFGSNTKVWWGFTAATGGLANKQVACLKENIVVYLQDSFNVCVGDSIRLEAPQSQTNVYEWSPSIGLTDSTKQFPLCYTTTDRMYTVRYQDLCGKWFKDSIWVNVKDKPIAPPINDTSFCDGANLIVRLPENIPIVLWNDGFNQKFRDLRKEGKYWIRYSNGACAISDTFSINVVEIPELTISGDTIFCENEQVDLTVGFNSKPSPFNWDDGSVENPRTFSNTSEGYVSSTNMCGTDTALFGTREVTFSKPALPDITEWCEDESLFINTNTTGTSYTWNTGLNDTALQITGPGIYWVEHEDHGCVYRDSTKVISTIPPDLNLPDDILLCTNEELVLKAEADRGNVSWNGEILDSFSLINFRGNIKVIARNRCGDDSTTIVVDTVTCYCIMYFPNAFTPNGDNLNSTFGPTTNCKNLLDYQLQVYNRWGEQVFYSEDPSNRWQGEFKRSTAQDGLYYFVCTYKGIERGLPQTKTEVGTIHLLR